MSPHLPSLALSEGESSDTIKSAAPTPLGPRSSYFNLTMQHLDSDPAAGSLFRFIFENSPDATVVLDESNGFLFLNRAARLTPTALLERLFAERAPWAFDIVRFRKEIATAGRSEIEVCIDDKRLRIRGLAHGRAQILTLRDLTDAASPGADESATGAHGEAGRTVDTGPAFDLAAASLVHDFNNLISPIASLSSVLLARLEEGTDTIDMVRDIKSAADRAASLARQILRSARRQSVSIDALSPSAVIGDLQQVIRSVAGPSVAIDLALTRSAARVRLDRESFERAILNLVANARDAMPSGGRITLTTAEIPLEDAATGDWNEGAYVVLRVSDTGVGMSEDVRERIFQAFFTTKDGDRGTGLGLPSVRRFVARSRGCIAVHSRAGCGTTVSLYFPVTPTS